MNTPKKLDDRDPAEVTPETCERDLAEWEQFKADEDRKMIRWVSRMAELQRKEVELTQALHQTALCLQNDDLGGTYALLTHLRDIGCPDQESLDTVDNVRKMVGERLGIDKEDLD